MTTVGTAQEIMKSSPIAPPIVHLARALGLKDAGLSVRDMRRATQALRESTPISKPNTPSVSAVPVIEIARLTVAYATKIALDSITTTVFDKEIVAVMGRNGAGKSSLLRSIAGVNEMQTGDVRVHSLVSKDLHSKLRRQTIGYIPQEPSDLLYAQSV